MVLVATPEWRRRARPPRHCRRRRDERTGRRRHRGDRGAAGSSAAAAASRRRRREEAAEREARRRDGSARLLDVSASSSSAKKPRLRSEVGLVRGCLWRFEPFSPDVDDIDVGVPAEDGVVVAPTSPSSRALAPADQCGGVVFAPEPALAEGGARTAPSSSTAAAHSTTTGVFFAYQLSVSALAPPPLSSQAAPQALVSTGTVAAPPPMPAASTPCPKRMKAMAIPSTSSRPVYAAIPAIPPFPTIHAPRQQPDADPDELRRAKVERFAGLIAKKQQETDERYRKLLRSGQAPPEESPNPVVVDEETVRRIAARKRFRETLAQDERKARGAALFVQMARREHLRALGIDKAMERVVSPERRRDENGAPVLSPEHPCCPLEKLGYFLKADQ